MIFIYNDDSKEVEYFYSGDISQIDLLRKQLNKKISEVIFPDNGMVIMSPQDYELVFDGDSCTGYTKKLNKKPIFDLPKPKDYLAIIEIQSILKNMGHKLEYSLE